MQVDARTLAASPVWIGRIDQSDSQVRRRYQTVEVAGATLLHIHLHHFTPNGGVSGVAVLSESHISIHSWPEANYAALDIFMCGHARPELAVPVLKAAFDAEQVVVKEHLRGEELSTVDWAAAAVANDADSLAERAVA